MTSNGFAALMALSQAQTQESTRAADSIQAERRRKEEIRRRQQEEEDRKERERQAKMLRHHLEEQKREKERQEKKEQEREAKLKEMERREEELRQALLYGPRKSREGAASRYPTSSSASASKRTSDDDDDDDGEALALTREEKRERRLQLQFSQNGTRRPGVSFSGTSRVGRRLPGGGGAIKPPTTTAGSKSASGGGHSVRARLTAMPNTLTKLNTVKRDTRTIDEILRDRAKARENKTLEGEEAREFHNWFGTKPKGGATTMAKATTSSPPSSAAASGASTPTGFSHRADASLNASRRPSSSPRPTGSRALPLSRPATKTAATSTTTSTKSSSHAAKLSRPFPLTNKAAASSSSVSLPKKRPPPHSGPRNLEIFGRDRSKYISRDVLSDDEDMEADMTALEREELTSARIARKEDLEAEEAERRHEEEKRRRRKERERSG
ncbi:hypothetical protein BGW80DRAFT_1475410 [Lactifluus volemus]|nr:hypothetical protein BGW80DRAFT_1475410 [Lactifluus volemus]